MRRGTRRVGTRVSTNGEEAMGEYILLADWTEQGIRNVKESPKHLDAARKLAKTRGPDGQTLHDHRQHDMVAHLEAPDDATVAKFVLSLAAAAMSAPPR